MQYRAQPCTYPTAAGSAVTAPPIFVGDGTGEGPWPKPSEVEDLLGELTSCDTGVLLLGSDEGVGVLIKSRMLIN